MSLHLSKRRRKVRPGSETNYFSRRTERKLIMPYVTVGKENGANIDVYYKDWGSGQPIVFSHGWPLSADDSDPQLLFFLSKGYRVIAHDRRGHGRSTQVADGHDLDHYADDLKVVTNHLGLKGT